MEKKRALEGVKVLNFSWVAAGPLVARPLALFGATVVRVENHATPDAARLVSPYKDGQPNPDKCPWFADVNSSTYGVTLNLNRPKGLEIALKLVRWADVMIENFTPGTMKKWGLDYEAVTRLNPEIIYLSVSQMGQDGPYGSFSSYGWQSTAIGGLSYPTGWPDRGPAFYHGAYTDFTGPRFGALAILAALDYRERTGKGQYLDQSQMENCAQFLAPYLLDFGVNGNILERCGNCHLSAVPHGVYPCKGEDRWCAIAVITEQHWRAFSKAIGDQAWCHQPEFATFIARKENEDELDRLVSQWTRSLTAEQIESILSGAGVPAGAVESTADLFEDQHIMERGFLRALQHSAMGVHTYRGSAFQLSKTPDNQFAGPTLGEHNERIFKEVMGLSDEQIAEALVEGGITTEADLPHLASVH